jgi:BASS family bile acid:Na+ symporter
MLFISTVAIPALVIFTMTVVGLDLTVADFRRVFAFPLLALAALASQIVVLPLIAGLLIKVLDPAPGVAGGLILVAVSPIGAISNYYALLARANVALAVTLTAISSVLALATTPLLAALGFELLLGPTSAIHFPLAKGILQIAIGLVLPIAVGMSIRHLAPEWTRRHHTTWMRLSLVVLAALVIYVLVDQAGVIARGLTQVVFMAVLFTLASLGAGYGLGYVLRKQLAERASVTIGFGIRNIGAALMIGATVLGRLDLVAFGAIFFLSQLAFIMPFLGWWRRAQSGVVSTGPAQSMPG